MTINGCEIRNLNRYTKSTLRTMGFADLMVAASSSPEIIRSRQQDADMGLGSSERRLNRPGNIELF